MVCEKGWDKADLTGPEVVARVIGEGERGGRLVVWHVSVRPSHPANALGRRWGLVRPYPRYDEEERRWEGSQRSFSGTPNPYAAECLFKTLLYGGFMSAELHPDMPISNLFGEGVLDHKTHPYTRLLLDAVGFEEGRLVVNPLRMQIRAEALRRSLREGMPMVEQGAPPIDAGVPPPSGAKVYERKLGPYPISDLSVSFRILPLWPEGDEEGARRLEEEYGFGRGSMQDRVLGKRGAAMAVLFSGRRAPETAYAENVVVRMIGMEHASGGRKEMEVYHLSSNRRHPLSRNGDGSRWGFHSVFSTRARGETRYHSIYDGKAFNEMTQRPEAVYGASLHSNIKGSPNPYACQLLAKAQVERGWERVYQNSQSHCASLFAGKRDHKSDPSTFLIFFSLGFTRTREALGAASPFLWTEEGHAPLPSSYSRIKHKMEAGKDVVE